MKNIIMAIFYLLFVISCTKQKPSDVALEYQRNKYLNYEKSYKFIKKDTIPFEVYMKYKNLSFLNLGYFEGSSLFQFKEISTKLVNNKAIVVIEITRPDFNSLKSSLFVSTIGSNKGLDPDEIKQKMKLAKKEKIIQTVELEKNIQDQWEVIP